MTPLELKTPDAHVTLDAGTATLCFTGSLRLAPRECESLAALLEQASAPGRLVLDFQQLTFCNSSGINVIYKFAMALRRRPGFQLRVRASPSAPWQAKSLPNLRRFLPDAVLEGL